MTQWQKFYGEKKWFQLIENTWSDLFKNSMVQYWQCCEGWVCTFCLFPVISGSLLSTLSHRRIFHRPAWILQLCLGQLLNHESLDLSQETYSGEIHCYSKTSLKIRLFTVAFTTGEYRQITQKKQKWKTYCQWLVVSAWSNLDKIPADCWRQNLA